MGDNISKHIVLYAIIAVIFIGVAFKIGRVCQNRKIDQLKTYAEMIKKDIESEIEISKEGLYQLAEYLQDTEDYDNIFNKYKPSGITKRIEILTDENILITQNAKVFLGQDIDFYTEALKGEHISGRVTDFTDTYKDVIKIALPVSTNGKVTKILYAVIPSGDFSDKYSLISDEAGIDIYVYEKTNGKLLVDTFRARLGNISDFANFDYKKGTSYEDLVSGNEGYVIYKSKFLHKNMYVYYTPLEISDWQIMIEKSWPGLYFMLKLYSL